MLATWDELIVQAVLPSSSLEEVMILLEVQRSKWVEACWNQREIHRNPKASRWVEMFNTVSWLVSYQYTYIYIYDPQKGIVPHKWSIQLAYPLISACGNWKWMAKLARLQQSQDVVRRWSMLHLWCFSQWLLDVLMAHGLVVWSFTLGWGVTRPPKLTCPQENLQWLEDSFPFEMAPFWGEMLVFCTHYLFACFFPNGIPGGIFVEQELLVHSPIMQKPMLRRPDQRCKTLSELEYIQSS